MKPNDKFTPPVKVMMILFKWSRVYSTEAESEHSLPLSKTTFSSSGSYVSTAAGLPSFSRCNHQNGKHTQLMPLSFLCGHNKNCVNSYL